MFQVATWQLIELLLVLLARVLIASIVGHYACRQATTCTCAGIGTVTWTREAGAPDVVALHSCHGPSWRYRDDCRLALPPARLRATDNLILYQRHHQHPQQHRHHLTYCFQPLPCIFYSLELFKNKRKKLDKAARSANSKKMKSDPFHIACNQAPFWERVFRFCSNEKKLWNVTLHLAFRQKRFL